MARFEHCAVAESCKHRIGLLGAIGCFPRVKPTWLSIRDPFGGFNANGMPDDARYVARAMHESG